MADGLYDLRVRVTDNAGNVTTSASVDDRRVDNTAPTLSSSAPSDGSKVAAAGSLTVTANEDLADVFGSAIDGSAVAGAVSGSTVTFTQAFAAGPHTLSGELEDLAGNRTPIRVHFTVWNTTGGDYPYIEKNSFASSGMTVADHERQRPAAHPGRSVERRARRRLARRARRPAAGRCGLERLRGRRATSTTSPPTGRSRAAR